MWSKLVPTLEDAGVTGLLVDADRFRAGVGVVRQMDATQVQADVFSKDRNTPSHG